MRRRRLVGGGSGGHAGSGAGAAAASSSSSHSRARSGGSSGTFILTARRARDTLIAADHDAKDDLGTLSFIARELEEMEEGHELIESLRLGVLKVVRGQQTAKELQQAAEKVMADLERGNPFQAPLTELAEAARAEREQRLTAESERAKEEEREAHRQREMSQRPKKEEGAAAGDEADEAGAKREKQERKKRRAADTAKDNRARKKKLGEDIRACLARVDTATMFRDEFAALKEQNAAWKPESDSEYKHFRLQVHSVHHRGEALPDEGGDSGDEDFAVINMGEETFECPITRQTLEEPMKNRDCSHSFSKAAIFGLLDAQHNMRIGCPVAGCNKFVSKSTLSRNTDLERKMKANEADVERRQMHDRLLGRTTSTQRRGDDDAEDL